MWKTIKENLTNELDKLSIEEIQDFLDEETDYEFSNEEIQNRIDTIKACENETFWANNKNTKGAGVFSLIYNIDNKLFTK